MTKLRFPRLLGLPAAGALVAATVMAAGPAAAGQGFGPHGFGGPHTNASNWGGYAASHSGLTSISGSWTEPVTKCHGSALAAPWLGLDGFGDQTVEQTGVAVSCSGSTAKFKGWYEMFPAPPHYFSKPVSAGDKFTASVTFKGGNSYHLSLTDNTKHWTEAETKSLNAKNASAEAVIEGPGGYPGWPNGVTFTNITVNGHPFSFYNPTKLNSGGFVPGPLNGGTFTIKHR